MIVAPRSENSWATVDLPLAIFPVRPTRSMGSPAVCASGAPGVDLCFGVAKLRTGNRTVNGRAQTGEYEREGTRERKGSCAPDTRASRADTRWRLPGRHRGQRHP